MNVCPSTPDGKHDPYKHATAKNGVKGYEMKCWACKKVLQEWKKG